MYSHQPLALLTTISTSAVAGTTVSTVILAAPGAGSAYRLVGWSGSSRRDVTGGIDVTLQSTGPVNFSAFSIGSPVAGTASFAYNPPEPGLSLPENVELLIAHTASVATQTFRFVVYYFKDRVN